LTAAVRRCTVLGFEVRSPTDRCSRPIVKVGEYLDAGVIPPAQLKEVA
jgi:hypothetical protein